MRNLENWYMYREKMSSTREEGKIEKRKQEDTDLLQLMNRLFLT